MGLVESFMIGDGNGDFGDFYVSLYGRWWGATDDRYRMKMGGRWGWKVVGSGLGGVERMDEGGWKVVGMCTSSLFCAVLEFGELGFLS